MNDTPTTICGYEVHPYANYFPLIEGKAFDRFVADIAENGQRDVALLVPGPRGKKLLVDGRNRGRACDQLKIKLKTEMWDGKGSLLKLVMSLNLHRRHLSPFQRASAIVPYKKELAAEAAKRRIAGLKQNRSAKNGGTDVEVAGDARELAADLADASHTYIDLAEKLYDSNSELYAGAIAGTVTYQQARVRVAKATRKRALPKSTAKMPADCRVVVGDCIVELNRMPERSVKVVFADPPYNNGWEYDGDPTGDDLPIGDYLDWCQQWMAAAARVLTEDGSIFVLIDDNYSDHFGVILRGLGLHRRNTIVWWEHFPEYTAGNFSRAARYVHYYTKHHKRFVWHAERVASRRMELGDPRANPSGRVPDNVWAITRKVGNAIDRVPFEEAPPQIPDELPLRCILAASEPGDVVLDPFNGNGTTGRAAVSCGRRYVGIELSKLYAAQAEQWIKAALVKESK